MSYRINNTNIRSGIACPEALRRLFFYFLFLLFLIVLSVNHATAQVAEIGKRAPNLLGFAVSDGSRINLYREMTEMRLKKDANGNLIKGENGKFVNDYTHYVTVLNFFAKTCIPCLREIPTFNHIAKKFNRRKVKFLYVNVDPFLPEAKAKVLIQQYQIEIPMMLVNQNDAIRKYGAQILPRMVVIDKNKKVSHIITGFNKNLETDLTNTINELL